MADLLIEGAGGEGRGGRAIVTVNGPATVRRAAELRAGLMEALDAAHEVVVDVGGVTATDATFFQLLCSARRTAACGKKRFTVVGSDSEPFRRGVEAGGFDSPAGCDAGMCGNCLWTGGDNK